VPPSSSSVDGARLAARRRGRALLVVVLAALFVAVGVVVSSAGDHRLNRAKDDPDRRLYVAEVTCTFVDHTRSSVSASTGAPLPYRSLETEIRYPTYAKGGGRTPASDKPFPLIVFALGYATMPDWYAPLLDEWVRAGFVVAAPIFPETNAVAVEEDKIPDAEDDDVHQPGDVAFVIHAMIADARTKSSACPTLSGLIEPSRIGLAGQSDGGDTVGMAAYDSEFDAHPGLDYRAVAVLSGAEWYYATGVPDPYADHPSAPPLLVVQSATDACNPPQDSAKFYDDDANTKKWFLEIFSADHLAPYIGTDPAALAIVARTTTRFFEIFVAGDGNSAKLAKIGDSEPQVARITTGATAPSMTPLSQSETACYVGAEGLKA
jgi:predicted dienelactone hydrolase